MKVRPSIKARCEHCKIIRRRGVTRVICKNPRHKARQGESPEGGVAPLPGPPPRKGCAGEAGARKGAVEASSDERNGERRWLELRAWICRGRSGERPRPRTSTGAGARRRAES